MKFRPYAVILAFLFIVCAIVAQDARVNVNMTPALGISSKLPASFLNAAGNPPDTGTQSGGRLEIVGTKNRYNVYLNGRGPDFLVGTVKDTKEHNLVLPPGMEHVFLVDPEGNKQIYSGYVEIKSGQKATLHVDKSGTFYEAWSGGSGMQAMPVGKPGVVPVKGTFTADNLVPCNGKAHLVWASNGYNSMLKVDNQVAYGGLAGSGDMWVDPGQNGTTFVFESFGPGGVFISDPQTVRVNKDVHATLAASPGVLRYHRVGDKVLEDPMVTLNWTADNADSVSIDPIGPVNGTGGQQLVKFDPGKSDYGNFDQTRMYKITASNNCGGTYTTTASVEVTGSIDPEIVATALPPVLPKTGSPLPLIALLGFGSMLSGLVLRFFRKN